MKFSIDDTEWEFDESTLLNTEAIKIQRETGYNLKTFFTVIREMDPIALTALVWITWLRNGKDVKFEDVVFDLTKIELVGDEVDPSPPPAT